VKAFLPWVRARAENVLALMMGAMFIAFIAQVVFRYALNLPLAWTEEACNFLWLWGILWGASFVMRSSEDMRFDMLYNLMPRSVRRGMTIVVSVLIVGILGASLPGAWSYISFMKVERAAAFGTPMNIVFSIYIVFVLAMIARHTLIGFNAINGRLVEDAATDAVTATATDTAKAG
jgi:C4-dicarboxylate transporter, DctQ subunit